MVQANPSDGGDGQIRRVQYATFRTDKAVSPGHSAELISNRVYPQYYDDLGAQPVEIAGCDTILKCHRHNVATVPNKEFLGTRQQLANSPEGKPVFGDYTWQTYGEIDVIC